MLEFDFEKGRDSRTLASSNIHFSFESGEHCGETYTGSFFVCTNPVQAATPEVWPMDRIFCLASGLLLTKLCQWMVASPATADRAHG